MSEITQADREAARPFMGDAVHYGHLDDHMLIQAFTAHRIAAEQRIVAWLREQDGYGYDDMRADCIEAGEHLK